MLFELSVALMRVLELTISVAPDVYLDWEGRDTAETLQTSLVQVSYTAVWPILACNRMELPRDNIVLSSHAV